MQSSTVIVALCSESARLKVQWYYNGHSVEKLFCRLPGSRGTRGLHLRQAGHVGVAQHQADVGMIANRRLLELDETHVSFRWKDYRPNGRDKDKVMRIESRPAFPR